MNILEQLLENCGLYKGLGMNHEGQDFNGELILTPVLSGQGLQLYFLAKGMKGEIFHEEQSVIAFNENNKLALYNLNTNIPYMAVHVLHDDFVMNEHSFSLTFKMGERDNQNSFREYVTLKKDAAGSLTYSYAWGMPGGEFEERSAVHTKKISADNFTANTRWSNV